MSGSSLASVQAPQTVPRTLLPSRMGRTLPVEQKAESAEGYKAAKGGQAKGKPAKEQGRREGQIQRLEGGCTPFVCALEGR